ncbi:hypothetical protein EMIT0P253_270005 [Pseudomonas sp. IT-P253]
MLSRPPMCTSSDIFPRGAHSSFSDSCVRFFRHFILYTPYLDLRPMGTLRVGADHGRNIQQQINKRLRSWL